MMWLIWCLVAVAMIPKVAPVTVCEALANRGKFNGKPLAIMGRIDCDISLIDHQCFLVEDHCDHPFVTKQHKWPNKVLIWGLWDEGTPRPPSSPALIDEVVFARELTQLSKTTKLGSHSQPSFAKGRKSILVKDQWGVAYGVLFASPDLKSHPCDDDEIGCGGFYGAPMTLITQKNMLKEIGTSRLNKAER